MAPDGVAELLDGGDGEADGAQEGRREAVEEQGGGAVAGLAGEKSGAYAAELGGHSSHPQSET